MNVPTGFHPFGPAAFFELDLQDHEATGLFADAAVEQWLGQLRAQHLLLLHHESAQIARTLARTLAQRLSHAERLPVQEWQGTAAQLDLYSTFSITHPAATPHFLTQPALFIVPDASECDLGDWAFTLQSALAQHGQYALLLTDIPQEGWQLEPAEAEAFWCAVQTDATPQHRRPAPPAQRLEGRANGRSAQTPPDDLTYAGEDIAALYHELDRDEQLYVVGFCLCGDLLDEHFFAAMERLIDDAWPHLRPSIGVFDHGELQSFAPLIHYLPLVGGAEKIEHRQPDQRVHLLRAIRRTRWNHLLHALPVYGTLVAEWVARDNGSEEASADGSPYAYVAGVAADVLGDVGRQSPRAVEETLRMLAVHDSEAVRNIAARALIGSPREDAQQPLYQMMTRWWQENPPSTDAASPESQRIRETVMQAAQGALAVHACRASGAARLPDALQQLLTVLMRDADAERELRAAIHAELLPHYARSLRELLILLAQDADRHRDMVSMVCSAAFSAEERRALLAEWQQQWTAERADSAELNWVPIAFVAAHANFLCGPEDHARYAWLADVLVQQDESAYPQIEQLLAQNEYAYAKVLPDSLLQLRHLLLYLAQKPEARDNLVDLFHQVHADAPGDVRDTLDSWHASWLQHQCEPNAGDEVAWDQVAITMRAICDKLGNPDWCPELRKRQQTDAQQSPSIPALPAAASSADSDDAAEPGDSVQFPADTEDEVRTFVLRDPHKEAQDAAMVPPRTTDALGEDVLGADERDLVRHAWRGEKEREAIIQRFVEAHQADAENVEERLDRWQAAALQALHSDTDISVAGLSLIGSIRDRIEEVERDGNR